MNKKTAATKIKYLRLPTDIAKRVEELARKESRSDSQQIVHMLRKQVAA